jgi:tetratricopeptide (TPR) repeat protein
MIPKGTTWRRRLLLLITLSAALCPACLASDASDAVSLYEEGRYAEARPLLEALDAKGKAGGTLLYRLAFCQRQAGETEAATATEKRALEALEGELEASRDVEVPFYLVNAYQNAGRDGDARRVAQEAASRFDKGDLTKPADGKGMFQIGKLYADSGADSRAVDWYGQAVDKLVAEGGSGSYLQRASSFLAERAWADQDSAAAAKYYAHLTADGGGGARELERLGVSQLRSRQYAEAAETWKEIPARFGPVNADRANYFSRLAAMAGKLDTLPATSADGREWTELSKVELEDVMKAEAAAVRQMMTDAAADEAWTREKRKRQQSRVGEHKSVLTAAAIEYGLRGHSLREAAFFGGFAPLILNESAWRLPRVLDDEGNPLGRKNKKGLRKQRDAEPGG